MDTFNYKKEKYLTIRHKKENYLTIMDTKKVNAMLVSIDRGSLTAAAAELGYTQSGLTHMMNSLEDELGLNLLVRSKNGVHLSPAGQELLPEMRALIEASDALEKGAERLRQRNFSTLRLGAYTSVARQWLPAVLAEFRRTCPDTEVAIDVGGATIYDELKNDQLDCAIVSYQEALCQGLSWIPLRDDELAVILPENYEIQAEAFPVREFTGKEFFMPSAGFDLDISPVFNLGGEKILPRIRYTNLDDGAIVSMVEHGLGVSILSDLIMQDINSNVKVMHLSPPAYRRLGIVISERRQNEKNIKRFVRCAHTVISKMYKAK